MNSHPPRAAAVPSKAADRSMEIERILFPVDLSNESRRISPYVRAAAEHFHAEVLMLYVMQLFPTWYDPSTHAILVGLADLDEYRAQRRAQLESFLRDQLASVPVVRVLAEGDPAEQIVLHAASHQIDLIMMGTRGEAPFRALLLGSVTAAVLHDTECPVWTAVHTDKPPLMVPNRWRRILCAVDATDRDLRTARWAAELARKETADLCLVHAIEGFGDESEVPENLRAVVLENARKKLAAFDGRMSIEWGAPERAVRRVASQWEADIVVIGRGLMQKPLGRLRSRAYAIIRGSPCPVISV